MEEVPIRQRYGEVVNGGNRAWLEVIGINRRWNEVMNVLFVNSSLHQA